MRRFVGGLIAALVWSLVTMPTAAEELTPQQASAALRKAVGFFREKVSASGGYLWRYSADLKSREGEGTATATQAWVQPPGTPTVGESLLAAYQRTGDTYYLEAAKETAYALVAGQLQSGGWDYRIEFDPVLRKKSAYRIDDASSPKAANTTTLDDNTTQAALRFLMHVDRELDQKDAKIHAAVEYALNALLAAQYANGAWPQRFSNPPNAAEFPVQRASYPPAWSREFPKQDYRSFYTLNDDTLADTAETMFEAAEIYGQPRYREAAARAGDFLLLAQMPDPQPAWAQQYNAAMQPAWARKFEPPAITGGESQGAVKLLLRVYQHTGDKKYLAPIPRALAYLQASELPGRRLARFYELKTNKPLYFTKQYELTYSSADMPTHYSFIVGSNAERLRADYEKLAAAPPDKLLPRRKPPTYKPSPQLTAQAQALVEALDSRGAWVEKGKLRGADNAGSSSQIIDCHTFCKNVELLSRYLAATK